MAAEIPATEPTEIVAGDTLAWTKSLSDWPADTWTLTYYLRGPASYTISTSASGTDHAAAATAAATALYVPGDYKLFGFVAAGSERYKIHESAIKVRPDVATITGVMEVRTDARIICDALIELQKQRATRPELSMSIQAAGRSFSYKSDEQLQNAIDYWTAKVAEETNPEGAGRTIVPSFEE